MESHPLSPEIRKGGHFSRRNAVTEKTMLQIGSCHLKEFEKLQEAPPGDEFKVSRNSDGRRYVLSRFQFI